MLKTVSSTNSTLKLSVPRVRRVPDPLCHGLFQEFNCGKRNWVFRFSDATGRLRKILIGDAALIPVEIARQRARRLNRSTRKDDVKPLVSVIPTYADYIRETYLPFAFSTKKSAGWEEIIQRVHLIPAFGAMRLNEITKSAITNLMIEKRQAGYACGTVNRILANLKTSLGKAAEWEIGGLDKSPAKLVKELKDPPHLDRYISQSEAERLLTAIRASNSPMLQFIIPFLLFTGARKREALDAKWTDINFETELWTIPITKSGKPRHIPLSSQALETLKATMAFLNQAGVGHVPWIFPNPKTQKPYVQIFHCWDACRKSVGLGDVRIHDLRHSFASALVNRGMTLYDVKEALGHANIATTQRYAHLSPDRLRQAVKQAGDHYAGTTANQTD